MTTVNGIKIHNSFYCNFIAVFALELDRVVAQIKTTRAPQREFTQIDLLTVNATPPTPEIDAGRVFPADGAFLIYIL
jgi:hypothetical protein